MTAPPARAVQRQRRPRGHRSLDTLDRPLAVREAGPQRDAARWARVGAVHLDARQHGRVVRHNEPVERRTRCPAPTFVRAVHSHAHPWRRHAAQVLAMRDRVLLQRRVPACALAHPQARVLRPPCTTCVRAVRPWRRHAAPVFAMQIGALLQHRVPAQALAHPQTRVRAARPPRLRLNAVFFYTVRCGWLRGVAARGLRGQPSGWGAEQLQQRRHRPWSRTTASTR